MSRGGGSFRCAKTTESSESRVERTHAGEALEEHAAERIDVGARVDRPALDLLGRDVVDRADEAAVARQAADRRGVPREAEVADVCVLALRARADEDVAGLHVTVDEPGRMRGIERLGDLPDNAHGAAPDRAGLRREQLSEIRAFDVLHRQIEGPSSSPDLDRRDDVRMVEARRELGLPQESLTEPLSRASSGASTFSAIRLPWRASSGEVHRAHRPFADESLYAETREDLANSNPGWHLLLTSLTRNMHVLK